MWIKGVEFDELMAILESPRSRAARKIEFLLQNLSGEWQEKLITRAYRWGGWRLKMILNRIREWCPGVNIRCLRLISHI